MSPVVERPVKGGSRALEQVEGQLNDLRHGLRQLLAEGDGDR